MLMRQSTYPTLEALLAAVRAFRACEAYLPLGRAISLGSSTTAGLSGNSYRCCTRKSKRSVRAELELLRIPATQDSKSGAQVCEVTAPIVAALDQESPLLPQPLRHAPMMRAGPLPRTAEAESSVPAVGCSPLGRLAIRSSRGRWHPLSLGIDVAAPL